MSQFSRYVFKNTSFTLQRRIKSILHDSFWTLPEEDAAAWPESLRRTKQGSPRLGSRRLRVRVRPRDKGTVPEHHPPVPMTVAPNRRGRSLPDDGGRIRTTAAGARVAAPVAWGSGRREVPRESETSLRILPTAPPVVPPAAPRRPLPGDGHALPAGRSLLAPPAPRGRSPRREVPAAAASPAAASPLGLAPHAAAASHSRGTAATTAGPRDPEPLPSGTASPRPRSGPAHCPRPRTGRLSHRPLLSTPSQGGCPAWTAPARAPAPSAGRSHLCRSVQGACAACGQSAGKEALHEVFQVLRSWGPGCWSSSLNQRQELGPMGFPQIKFSTQKTKPPLWTSQIG